MATMFENPVPVKCPECSQVTLIIKPGDKFYCLNDSCLYCERLPTDPQPPDGGVYMMPVNYRAWRYYVRQLESEVRLARGL